MKLETLANVSENKRKNGVKLGENGEKVLSLLCENIGLLTGEKCEFDLLCDGSVALRYEGETFLFKNLFQATAYLNSELEFSFGWEVIQL